MTLNLRHLHAFALLAKELHFGRTAEMLHVAQPALTKTIKQLEAEIGCPLLVRSTRRVELTEAGKVLLAETADISTRIERAVEHTRQAAQGLRGELRVAYVDFAINGKLPEFLRDFNHAHPDIHLDLIFMPTVHQHVALLQQKIDIGFLYGDFRHQATQSLTFAEDRYVAVLPKNHPLATKDNLTLSDLKDQKFVFGIGDSWYIFRRQIFAECRMRGFFPHIALEATNSDGIFGLVIAGTGVTIYSSCLKEVPRHGIALRPLSDLTTKLLVTAVWERANRSHLLETFLRFLRRSLRDTKFDPEKGE